MTADGGIEAKRLNTILERDGLDAALFFARQSLSLYRQAVLTSAKRGAQKIHFASTPAYRASFIRSYLGFKQFVAARG